MVTAAKVMGLYDNLEFLLNEVRPKLDMFDRKHPYVFNFRCPFCGDSKKKKNKKRGYIYKIKNDLNFKCHNCGISMKFKSFLRNLDKSLYDAYITRHFKNTDDKKNDAVFASYLKAKSNPTLSNFKSVCTPLNKLEGTHAAVDYLKSRGILAMPSNVYYIDSTCKLSMLDPEKYSSLNKLKSPRILFVSLDFQGHLTKIKARTINDSGWEPRFVSLSFGESNPFNWENVDHKSRIYVVEGEMDALSVNNAIAKGSSDLYNVHVDGESTYVYDNELNNKEIVTGMKHTLNLGRDLMFWPEGIPYKDLNEIKSVRPDLNLSKFIDKHTYRGLEGQLMLSSRIR